MKNTPKRSSTQAWRLRSAVVAYALITLTGIAGCSDDNDKKADDLSAVDQRSNVLVILTDDLGYSDVGAFGGEIATPNIDALANEGRILTNFHTGATCSPTRSMLLSGADHHLVGLGQMAEAVGAWVAADVPPLAPFGQSNGIGINDIPEGYVGHLNDKALSMAEILNDNGYGTYMAGKWHLGFEPSTPTDTNPFNISVLPDQFPNSKGFDRSFVLANGGGAHFAPPVVPTPMDLVTYADDGVIIQGEQLPDDYFSTAYFTDKIIEYIGESKEADKPFFAYAAYTAPHWPLQAPQEDIDAQKGHYDEGYEVIRARRISRLKELGLVPESFVDNPGLASVVEGGVGKKRWNELTAEEKAKQARLMEVYAAMVSNMDRHIGRLIQHLKDTDSYDNTMIVFLSDNGAEGSHFLPVAGNFDNSIENLGKPGSMADYGERWAEVSAAPFRLWKSQNGAEGATSVPAIVKMPKQSAQRETITALTHVTDLLPTILELAEIESPGSDYNGRPVHPISGVSLLTALNKAPNTTAIRSDDDVLADELFFNPYVKKGNWKLSRNATIGAPPANVAEVPWQLFDMSEDRGETVDLAATYPDIVTELVGDWDAYVEANSVLMTPFTIDLPRDADAP